MKITYLTTAPYTAIKYTYYTYDAGGNLMATYTRNTELQKLGKKDGLLYVYRAKNPDLSLSHLTYEAYLYWEGNIQRCPKVEWMMEVKSIKRISIFWYKIVYRN